jgi:chemotaxis protein MotB
MANNAGGITVIKRKKGGGDHGHHGGAWKVAYADFVTAMMAFFLMMWLLNATSEEQRQGIADFFNPSIPLTRVSGGGNDLFNGKTQFEQETLTASASGAADTETATTAERVEEGEIVKGPADESLGPQGEGGESNIASEQGGVDPAEAAAEQAAFEEMAAAFEAVSGESEVADQLLKHVRTRVTDEGLVIEIFDKDGDPLYAAGSAQPSQKMTQLLSLVASVVSLVGNEVAIEGHTDASPFVGAGDYGNWELSSDRANAARRLLIGGGVAAERLARVTGKADTEPALEDPTAPQNRRIAITLLRSDWNKN